MESTPVSAPALLHTTIQRLASQSATCKLISVVLGAAALLFGAGRTGGDTLLWAVAPALLLALADASYVSKARRIADAASKYGSNTPKIGELIQLQVGGCGLSEAATGLLGMLSFSVWPFYASLAGLVIGLGTTVVVPKTQPTPTTPSFPFSQQKSFPTTNFQSQGLQRPVGSQNTINLPPRPVPVNAPNSFQRNGQPGSVTTPPSFPPNANRPSTTTPTPLPSTIVPKPSGAPVNGQAPTPTSSAKPAGDSPTPAQSQPASPPAPDNSAK